MNPDALNRCPGKWLQKYEISLIKTKRECQNSFEYSKVKILLEKYKIYVYLFFLPPKVYPTETPVLL